ncbi:MAG TPA: SDR family oxidoreductase [Pseudomonadales bacterium]|nr:SDR family oxidoreductase [Pseudomonadales bacterium]
MTDRAEFTGREVVVTGGTGALGTAVVGRLLEAGARVHVPCLVASELERFPYDDDERVRVVHPVELADEAAVARFYDGIDDLWASVHIAGGFAFTPLAEVGADDLEAQMRMNASTCLLCCKVAAARMEKGGRIVNVTARPALDARQGANLSAYVASKAAVAALTQALASELLESGVLVNAIAPSVIDTPSNRSAMPDAEADRWVKPEDAAEVIAFLISPRNRVVSGALVPVYGRA